MAKHYRKKTLLHKELSNLDGSLSKFSNVTYPGSRILKVGANSAALQLPTDIAGLWAWYDVGDSSTVWKDSAATTHPALGERISQIDDKSGNARHVANGGDNSAIRLRNMFNGLAAAHFGTKQGESSITNQGTNVIATPLTVVSAHISETDAAGYGYLCYFGQGGAELLVLESDAFGFTGPGFYDTAHDSFGISTSLNEPDVYSWVFRADNDAAFYQNTTELGTRAAYTSRNTSGNLWLSIGVDASTFAGGLRELAVFEGELSLTDLAYVVAGMRARANLPVSNPHPQFSGVDSWRWSAKTLTIPDGDIVEVWPDTQNGICLRQNTSTVHPLYRANYASSGYPGVEFDGSNDFLQTAGDAFSPGNTNTCFVVWTGMTNVPGAFFDSNVVTGSKRQLLYVTSGGLLVTFNGINGGTKTYDNNEMITVVESDTSGETELYTGKTLFEGSLNDGVNGFTGLTVGSYYNGSNIANGACRELIFYDGILTAPQIAEVWTYLEAEWGL